MKHKSTGSGGAAMKLHRSQSYPSGKWLQGCEMGSRWDGFMEKNFGDIICRCDCTHPCGCARELTVWDETVGVEETCQALMNTHYTQPKRKQPIDSKCLPRM